MTPGTYKLLTDALIVFHFTFVAFVVVGGLLALRWWRVAWFHIPAVLWVIWVETSASICPLTPLENSLREQAGLATYEGGFVDHYIMPVLYPSDLTRTMQFSIAGGLLLLNGVCYTLLLLRIRRKRRLERLSPHELPEAALAVDRTPDNVAPQ